MIAALIVVGIACLVIGSVATLAVLYVLALNAILRSIQ